VHFRRAKWLASEREEGEEGDSETCFMTVNGCRFGCGKRRAGWFSKAANELESGMVGAEGSTQGQLTIDLPVFYALQITLPPYQYSLRDPLPFCTPEDSPVILFGSIKGHRTSLLRPSGGRSFTDRIFKSSASRMRDS